MFHPLNAYDVDDGRRGAWSTSSATRRCSTDGTNGPNEGDPVLERWTIDRRAGKVIEEPLDDRPQSSPPRRAAHRPAAPLRVRRGRSAAASRHGGALKHDLEAGTTERHDFGPGRMTLEPVFVPRSADAAEDDGWLLSYVYDAATDRSDVVDPRRRRTSRASPWPPSTCPSGCRSASTATGCPTGGARAVTPSPGRAVPAPRGRGPVGMSGRQRMRRASASTVVPSASSCWARATGWSRGQLSPRPPPRRSPFVRPPEVRPDGRGR